MKPKSLLLLITALLFYTTTFCQGKKDTIYFDEEWSICEKPVAEYYRVCALNADSLFYKGEVKDYYIDGHLEMTGDYSINGIKNGEFDFYNNKGFLIKKGEFLNNVMMGDWYFYDSLGRLKSQFFCKTQLDFTPVLLIDNNNDTLVKNGTGEFVLNNVTEYQYIQSKYGFMVKGKVRNGVKDGELKYYSYPKKQLLLTEKYEDGRFIKSKLDQYAYAQGWTDDRIFVLSLSDLNLDKTDEFYHANMAFGVGVQGLQKLINFLSLNISPSIPATDISAKDKICFNIIFKVLVDKLMKDSIALITNDIEDGNKSETLSTSNINNIQLNALPKFHGDITLTVDTTGQISNCNFETNLPDAEVYKLGYYLKHISNLPIAKDSGIKVSRTLNLQLNTIIDSQKNNLYILKYVLSNPKAFVPAVDIPKETTGDYDKIYTSVQVESQFPGGQDAWRKYLERNLNAQTPADHGAPNGIYTVTVSFIVSENGEVSDVRAENNPGYGTAEEAVRIIKKGPAWKPAIQNGKNVNYRQKQNITFQVTSF